jgi:hypothetical protein
MPQKHPFLTEDSEAAFAHFAKKVEHLPAAELEHWNADAEIVRVNIVRAVDAIRPHLDRIAEELPRLKLHELLELPALALALGFAADKVVVPASKQEIKARQLRLRPVRSQGLRYLEIAAEKKLVPSERVRNIRAGTGPVDEARDGVAIVAVFREFSAALTNKHPFDDQEMQQLAEDGNWLLQQLRPTGALPEKVEKSPEALVRDRLWTEVIRRFDELVKAGTVIWGPRAVDAHLPALLARAPSPAAQPAPATPEAPATTPDAPPKPS